MKRLYRVTVTVEREFERVATREAKKVALALGAEAIVRGWTVAKKVVTNRARAERSEREKPIDFGTIWEDVAASQAITTLREIAADMATILGNVKRPRVEYAPNFWCDGRFTHNTAHAHNVNGVRWSRNLTGKYAKYAGRKIPKGLICISRKHLLRMDSEKWPWLMAHEIMHVRMPGDSHKRASFRENVDALLMKYEAMKQDHERRLDGALTESPEPKSVLDIDDGSATSRVSRVARLTDLDIEAFNEVDLALYRISGDPNRCSLAVGTGDCPFHRNYTCHTVLADVEVVE